MAALFFSRGSFPPVDSSLGRFRATSRRATPSAQELSGLFGIWMARPVFSRQKYANFHQMTFNLSREWEFGSLVIPEGHGFIESLLGELRLSKIWGKNIPLEPDEVSPENAEKFRQEGRSPTADWDHYQVAITPFYRVYYPLSTRARPYGEIGAGIS